MKQTRAGLVGAAFVLWAAAAFSADASRSGMVLLPAGGYTPFLRLKAPNPSAPAPRNLLRVGAFRLDVEPVTNGEFLDFVMAHSEWRRSRIKPLFADHRYPDAGPAR
jgi:formylglycine-generating enzyme